MGGEESEREKVREKVRRKAEKNEKVREKVMLSRLLESGHVSMSPTCAGREVEEESSSKSNCKYVSDQGSHD